jgi:hypothetical protein
LLCCTLLEDNLLHRLCVCMIYRGNVFKQLIMLGTCSLVPINFWLYQS